MVVVINCEQVGMIVVIKCEQVGYGGSYKV